VHIVREAVQQHHWLAVRGAMVLVGDLQRDGANCPQQGRLFFFLKKKEAKKTSFIWTEPK
jgi:hypothetical protein